MLTFKDGKEQFSGKNGRETVDILFTGDFCPFTPESRQLIRDGKAGDILSPIKKILDNCDLSVIECETPLTDEGKPIIKSGPNLKSPAYCVDFIKKGRFDVALLANNHIGDIGGGAVMETLDILHRNGIKTVGAGQNLETAVRPLLIRKNGIRVAILNIAENEFGGSGVNNPGSNPLNPARNISQIIALSKKTDLVIVTIHGGNELNPFPTPRMVDACRAFADAGAAAVVAIHTHCPQGIEIRNGKPIVYSLGNFYFPYPDEPYTPSKFWWKGYLLKLKFTKTKAYALEVIPTSFGPDESKIIPFSGAARDKFFAYLAELSAAVGDDRKISRVFDACCAKFGYGYLNSVRHCAANWPTENDPEKIKTLLADPAKFKLMMILRNLFNCETHHEIIAGYLRLIEDGRIDEAAKHIAELEQYCNADFGF